MLYLMCVRQPLSFEFCDLGQWPLRSQQQGKRRHADSYLLILEVTLVTSAHGPLSRTFDPLQGSLGDVRSM